MLHVGDETMNHAAQTSVTQDTGINCNKCLSRGIKKSTKKKKRKNCRFWLRIKMGFEKETASIRAMKDG